MEKEIALARTIILSLKTKQKVISFTQLCKNVCSKLKMKPEAFEEIVTDFYIALLEDPDFIKLNNNDWTLKEFYNFDEVQKIISPVYVTEEFEINEDEYKEYLSSQEIKELNSKKIRESSALDLREMYAPKDTNPTKLLDDEDDAEENLDDEGENYNE